MPERYRRAVERLGRGLPDLETVYRRAIERSRRALAEHEATPSRSAEDTLARLTDILEDEELIDSLREAELDAAPVRRRV